MNRSGNSTKRNPALPYVHGIPAHVYRTAYRPLSRAGRRVDAIGVARLGGAARAARVADG